MNTISRTITGIVMILLGLGLIMFSFLESLFLLIYGIPLVVIGCFVLFNEKEDTIEKIKDRSEQENKQK
jgi:membrane-bound ClpP family serine protease